MNNKFIENKNNYQYHSLWGVHTIGDKISCKEYHLPLNLIVLKEELSKKESYICISDEDSIAFVIKDSVLVSYIGFEYVSNETFYNSFVCDIEGNLLRIHSIDNLKEYITDKNKLLETISSSEDSLLSYNKYKSVLLPNVDFLSKWKANSIHLENGSIINDTFPINIKDRSSRGARADSIIKF